MKKRTKNVRIESILIILGLCLVQSCIWQEDDSRPNGPGDQNQCVTPLCVHSPFTVIPNGISMSSDGSVVAVLHVLEGLYLFTNTGEVIWSSDRFGGLFPLITEDGSHLIAQIRRRTTEDPFFLVKIDRDGNIVWKREIGLIGLDGLSMSPDGSFVAVGYVDQDKEGHLVLFDQDGNKLWGHQIDGRIETVAVSKSGYVAAGPRDRYIYLYDRHGELIFTYFADSYYDTQDTAIAPDESFFLFGSEHMYLNCYTLEGEVLWQREVGDLCNIRISADGEYIAVGTASSTLFLFDKNGNELWNKKVTDALFIEEVSISAHGDYIAINTQSGLFPLALCVEVYSKEGELLWRYRGNQPFMAIAISDDGQYIVAGNQNMLVFFDNFSAIEEYAASECTQLDKSLLFYRFTSI